MTHQDETEAPARPSLYDRLGGVYNIAPVVDDLIHRVMSDVYSRSIGFQPFGDLLLAEADRLTG